jgi:TonB family protein
MPLAFFSALSALAMFAAAISPARAVQTAATPAAAPSAASRCAHPNVGARTLHAVAPEVPPQVIHFGVGGRVVVIVSLAADGHILAARAAGASSRFLEPSALAAARASKFAPAVRNCVQVGGTYTFVVDYSPPTQLPEQHADPLTYFLGAWHCTTASGNARTLTFTPNAAGLSENDGSTTTTLTRDQYHVWRIRRNGRLIGWAFPWVDDTWTWGANGSDADLVRYEADDDATFTMTTTVGATLANIAQTETCKRAPSS